MPSNNDLTTPGASFNEDSQTNTSAKKAFYRDSAFTLASLAMTALSVYGVLIGIHKFQQPEKNRPDVGEPVGFSSQGNGLKLAACSGAAALTGIVTTFLSAQIMLDSWRNMQRNPGDMPMHNVAPSSSREANSNGRASTTIPRDASNDSELREVITQPAPAVIQGGPRRPR